LATWRRNNLLPQRQIFANLSSGWRPFIIFVKKVFFCGAVEMQKTAVISEMAANIKKLQKLSQIVIEISILEIFFLSTIPFHVPAVS
jgi:hypothetical protein